MTLRGHQLETSTQRNARKRAFEDRGCISQRGDEVRERFRSKSGRTGTSGEKGGGGKGGERTKRKKWIYIRDHDSGALAEFRRGESEWRKLPGTAWICPIGSLLARLFHGPGIVVTNVQTIAATITPLPPPLPTSHNEPLFASSLGVRAVCSTRDTRSALAVFSIFVIILFLLSYLRVCGACRNVLSENFMKVE